MNGLQSGFPLLFTSSSLLQDGAALRHCCHSPWRQNPQAEDEDGSPQPHVCSVFPLTQHIYGIPVNRCSVSSRFFDLFEKYGGYKTGKLKLKKPKQLQVTLLRRVAFALCDGDVLILFL